MQFATEQVQVEIDQMYLEHQSQLLREGRIEDIYSTIIISIRVDLEKKIRSIEKKYIITEIHFYRVMILLFHEVNKSLNFKLFFLLYI